MADIFWCEVLRQTVPLKPHFHNSYALGLVTTGTSRYECGRHSFQTDAVTAHLINPGEVHAALPSSAGPIAYTTFHIGQDYVRDVVGDGRELAFGRYVEGRADIIAALRTAAAVPADAGMRHLAIEAMLLSVLPVLMGRGQAAAAASLHGPGLQRAYDFMREHALDGVTLAEIAAVAHLERCHFVRQFKRYFGMPPHHMLIQLRIIAARQRLFAGESAASVASACGFTDQSHLIRQWRAVYAIPPSRVQKVNFVQSS